MNIQRLRNLTTGRLHTQMQDIYEDMEYLTGMQGIMTHMLPRVADAMTPWLKEKVADIRFWDDKFDVSHIGEYDIQPMSKEEQKECIERYKSLPSLLDRLGEDIK